MRIGLWVVPVTFLVASCGARRFTPPGGPGSPFSDFSAAFEQATTDCRGTKTIKVTLSLSGRAAGAGLRGQVDAGFAAPGEARLEGRAPFGRPVFILVARNAASATLVLPRDNRVLRDAPPSAIVEALTGVALDADELRSAVAGCGFGGPPAQEGRAYGGNWVVVDAGNVTHYLRRVDGRWRLMASARSPLVIEYRDFASRRPATIRMRTVPQTPGPQTDLTVKLSDVSINVPLEPDVFQIAIPAGAEPLTLGELRRAGPLGSAAPR